MSVDLQLQNKKLINEDISLKIVGMGIFSLAAFLGNKVSRKMIQVGNKIASIPYFQTLIVLRKIITKLEK